MALFRRNKIDQEGMPPEVQSYYQAENQQRSWVAWLMALGTLLVTVFIVLGLFFGGRWVFRKLKNGGQPVVTTTQTETTKPAATTTPKTPNTATTPSKPTTPTPASTPQTSSTSTSQPSSQTTTPTTTATPSQQTTGTMPNTGPGDLVAVFVLTSIIGTVFYDRVLRNRV